MSLTLKEIYRFEEFELNCARRALLREGQPVPLPPKAFEVLAYLVIHPGEVVTKDELIQAVWPESFVEEGNLAHQVSSIRRAFADRAGYIVTIPGRGYQFTAEVERHIPAQPERSGPGEPHPVEQTIVGIHTVRERTHIVMEESESARRATLARRISFAWVAWGVAGTVLLAVAGNFAWKRFVPQPQLRKVMVADFLNLTGDVSMDSTLKSALKIGLSQTPYIQLMSEGLAHSTLQEMGKKPDTPLLGDTALEVCRRGHYEALLRGTIEHPQGYDYHLSLEAVNCATDASLFVFRGQALNEDEILDALDGLSRRTRVRLGEPNASLDRFNVPLIEATTSSFEALKDYNAGSVLGNEDKLNEAMGYFQKAVDIDPKFALAQAALGTAYWDLGSMDTAAKHSKKGFELSSNVSQSEKFYIRSTYYLMAARDLQEAAKNDEEWTKVYPTDETAWGSLANAEVLIGNFDHAIEAGEHIMKYGPSRPELMYNSLADAYKRANRFADAKRIIAEAQAQGKDAPDLHRLLYQIAMIEQDSETLKREAQWLKGKPEMYALLESQAVFAADEGKYREAEDLFGSAVAEAGREINPELADDILLDEAGVEVQLGRTPKAAELLRNIQHRDGADFAILQTQAGNPTAGEAYLLKPEKYPRDTIEHSLRIPELRALVALRHNDPDGAIAGLEPARSLDLVRPEVMEVRAEAYLAARQPDKAEVEFQKIIANPGLEDIMQPRTVLAHLGLARAYALENKTAESRSEYEKFFALWKDADTDIPALKQAHGEYAQTGKGD
jgi:eukaryotic-like serine/threonine-protein kinase